MEALIHQAKETPTKFQKTWAYWLHFKESADFHNLLIDSQSLDLGKPTRHCMPTRKIQIQADTPPFFLLSPEQ